MYVRICEQYTTAQAVSSSMGDGVITAVMALHTLSDMVLVHVFDPGAFSYAARSNCCLPAQNQKTLK